MKDLMAEILEARKIANLYNRNVLGIIVTEFLNFDSKNRIDWDEVSGEEWVDFSCGTELIAILHTKFPICFAKPNFKEFCTQYNKFWTIFTDSFDNEEWFVDIDQLKNIENISWHASKEAVNPNSFSVFDFRFATV